MQRQKRADKRKYHYIYKITRDDGKFYIGMHSTDNLDDGYFGSGKRVTRSIKKHGRERHSKNILEFLPTREALKLREEEIVCEELLNDTRCMNLRTGGDGNSSEDSRRIWENNPGLRQAASERASRNWKDPVYKEKVLTSRAYWHPSEEHLKSISEKNIANWAARTEEERAEISRKISEACIEKCKDPAHQAKTSDALKEPWKDPEYRARMSLRNKGSIFVVNKDGCKGIWPDQLEEYLARGYVRGRKLKGKQHAR